MRAPHASRCLPGKNNISVKLNVDCRLKSEIVSGHLGGKDFRLGPFLVE